MLGSLQHKNRNNCSLKCSFFLPRNKLDSITEMLLKKKSPSRQLIKHCVMQKQRTKNPLLYEKQLRRINRKNVRPSVMYPTAIVIMATKKQMTQREADMFAHHSFYNNWKKWEPKFRRDLEKKNKKKKKRYFMAARELILYLKVW